MDWRRVQDTVYVTVLRRRRADTKPASRRRAADSDPGDRDRSDEQDALQGLGWFVPGIPLAAGAALIAYSFTLTSSQAFAALGSGVAIALAAAAAGYLLGFLFGLPRSVKDDNSGGEERGFRPNTNLEEISDWLTKILVGVGLIQIGNAGGPARDLVRAAGEPLGNDGAARALAASLILVSLVWGFLVSYLLTMTRILRVFRLSEVEQVARRAASMATGAVQQRLDDQAGNDASALTLADNILNPAPGAPIPTREELAESLRKASPAVRAQIFYRAQQQRRAAWRNDKPRMEATAPIFQALIDVDPDKRYHRPRAQLAYVLKDKINPDWSGAEKLVDEAIGIRGPASAGWLLYEYNRAFCRIKLDPAPPGQPSDEKRRATILTDLRTAAAHNGVFAIISKDQEVVDWLRRNQLELADLRQRP